MLQTRVGYAGGTTARPTYRRIGDHAEAIELVYDPAVVTYEALVRRFWTLHEPHRPSWSRQYMSALFFADAAEEEVARRVMAEFAATRGTALHTELIGGAEFTRAEDYHQKYYLRRDEALMREFAGYGERDFEDSRVAARLNGYVAGEGSSLRLAREVESFGLSAEGAARLRAVVARA
ncbi:MAG: peptide methionine sulfoxide reductase [Myxococcaceae bacterium]|nr:peptide methionine sulfoxide reductase [Myxococcaceae bacterium]